jgi:REP element-mobilizing transposase RayT
LGDVIDGQVHLSPLGGIVLEEWQKIPERHPQAILDELVIMPDHLHGILVFQGIAVETEGSNLLSGSLGVVIGQFKSTCTKRIRWDLLRENFEWQERFHDTILENAEALERFRTYIRENPTRWKPKDIK